MILFNVEQKELLDLLFNTEIKSRKESFILLHSSIAVKLLLNGLF